MWIKGISWPGLVACSILYGAIYIAVRFPLPVGYVGHAQLGLLLFLLPGALAALTSKEAPLTAMALAIALASASLPGANAAECISSSGAGSGDRVYHQRSVLVWFRDVGSDVGQDAAGDAASAAVVGVGHARPLR